MVRVLGAVLQRCVVLSQADVLSHRQDLLHLGVRNDIPRPSCVTARFLRARLLT